MKKYLSVGELARTFGLDVQTLHYYDSIGLFQPEIRDEKTRYRKYRFDQIYQLASIRYLRKMGHSLDHIQAYLDSRNPENSLDLLGKRSEELQRQWAQLMRINEAIERKIQFVNDERSHLALTEVVVRSFPARYYIPIGSEEILYLEDSFYFYPTIAFYEGDLKYFGAYLYEPTHAAATRMPVANSVPAIGKAAAIPPPRARQTRRSMCSHAVGRATGRKCTRISKQAFSSLGSSRRARKPAARYNTVSLRPAAS